MSKYGTKRRCPKCKTLYYDFNKRNHECPSCSPDRIKKAAASIKQKEADPKRGEKAAITHKVELINKSDVSTEYGITNEGDKIKLPKNCKAKGFYAASSAMIVDNKIKNQSDLVYLGEPPLEGLKSYLGGSRFKGVGGITASEVAKNFKSESFKILSSEDALTEKYLTIPEKTLQIIRANWKENIETNIYSVFLLELGFSDGQVKEISEKIGAGIINLLNTQPFSLIKQIKRFSFLDLERIFVRLGITVSEEQRILAATEYSLEKVESERRHTCVPVEIILAKVEELLSTDQENVQKVLQKNKTFFFFGERRNKNIISTLSSAKRDEALMEEYKRIWGKFKQKKKNTLFGLGDIETSEDINLSEEQIEAINIALKTPVSVITGGPGSGKTTLVQGLVALTKELKIKTRLCAPTGKAAKRLAENPEIKSLSPSTIHLYLAQQASKPAKFQMMIVDEASMIDVDLLLELFSSIPDGASVVLIGDRDQLPPVASGQPFKDFIESEKLEVARLTGNFRQDHFSNTVKAARSIIRGQLPELDTGLSENDFLFIETPPEQQAAAILKNYFEFIPDKLGIEPQDVQILAAQRTGDVGVMRLNELIQEQLISKTKKPLFTKKDRNKEVEFYPGDKVINRKNNYQHGVMNGDQGIILRSEGGNLIVEFESPEKGAREVEFQGLEKFQLDLAYATTVHSSQGSEYPGVIIPVVSAHSHMLSRNLLYTAITRGKKQVCLVGEQRAFEIAIKQYAKDFRYTYLPELIKAEH